MIENSSKNNMNKFLINQYGYWENPDNSKHQFDSKLCKQIVSVMQSYHINTVYDFGCGEGKYATELRNNNINCLAYDGNPHTPEISNGVGQVLNLAEEFTMPKVDAVLSLEVGEHIPSEYESIFIQNLCYHCSRLMILSWAVVGQNGTGHVNCKNNNYIIDKITNYNFKYNENITQLLRDNSTLWYFKNTILVFERNNHG